MKTLSECRSHHFATRIGLPAMIIGASMFLAACASTPAPTEQVAVSKAAVADAASAGGTASAPVEMLSAREKLAGADAAMATKDYDRARTLAKEAEVDAQLAEAKAHSSKAQKAADEVREGSRVLREEINRKSK